MRFVFTIATDPILTYKQVASLLSLENLFCMGSTRKKRTSLKISWLMSLLACMGAIGLLIGGMHHTSPENLQPLSRHGQSVFKTSLLLQNDLAIREPLQAPLWSPIIRDALIGYTAHWDVRALHGLQPPYVRILATALNMARINVTMRFECKFYYDNGTTALAWGSLVDHKTNSGFFMLCPARGLVHGPRDAPSSVSILCGECQSQWTFELYGNKMLSSFDVKAIQRHNLAVCVRPTYGPVDDPMQLIQFLMYYILAGATHFTFYNTRGMSPRTAQVFRRAQEIGISLEILPWNYEYGDRAPWSYNQYMAINACLYWQMPDYEHSAMVDMDEFISPRGKHNRSLIDMLAILDGKHPNAAAYHFSNNFFFPDEGSDPAFDGITLPFDMFHATTRFGPYPTFPKFDRSKAIFKTSRVVRAAIHNMDEPVPGYDAIHTQANTSGLFHYRHRPSVPINKSKALYKGERDIEMLKFYDPMTRHVFLDPLLNSAFG